MKRGLKDCQSYSFCIVSIVATYAPMKRGLKGHWYGMMVGSSPSSNLCPDEKGTESSHQGWYLLDRACSSNLCPDEKGTESLFEHLARELEGGSNLCPDEKGTERDRVRVSAYPVIFVATYAPTKRGLKVDSV